MPPATQTSRPRDGQLRDGQLRDVPSDVAVLTLIKNSIVQLDDVREELARTYVDAPSGTPVEHEVGEVLVTVRKALARLRKARGELAEYTQLELPRDE